MKIFSFCFILLGLHISCVQQSESNIEVPATLPKFSVLINKKDFDGYVFLRSAKKPGAQLMIDKDGKIVWYQLSDTKLAIECTPYETSYLSLYTPEKLYEISYGGDTLLELSFGEGGFDRPLHHEIIKDANNDIIALTHETIPIDLSTVGGGAIDTIRTDGIIKLSRSGQKLWSWNLTQAIDPLKFSDMNKYKMDWGHANSLMIDQDGHYLLSWRDFNQVWKINSVTGEVLWKYGGEFSQVTQDKFYQQHSINRNRDGDYMVFDNGMDSIRRFSRAVMFNDFGNSIRNTYTVDLADSLFTPKKGSVYQFEKDRFLFCSTMAKALVITNRKGEVLWLAISNEEFYRAFYLEKSVLD